MKNLKFFLPVLVILLCSISPCISKVDVKASNEESKVDDAKIEEKKEHEFIEKTKHPNGKVWFERRFINGKLQGISKEYYDNGSLKMEANFVDNKLEGLAKYYFPSGKLQATIEHKNNMPNGKGVVYLESGEILGNYNYKDGQFNGLCKEFYKKGNVKYEYEYALGNLLKTKTFSKDGKLKSEETNPNSKKAEENKEESKT